jgi:hypothetical protein
MAGLEGPDEQITLKRAAELAGLQQITLRRSAISGRLVASRPARDWFTTRRHLHTYLIGRRRGVVKPLPEGYQAPEMEDSTR